MPTKILSSSTTTSISIRDYHGYISIYDYKAIREDLYRARSWKNLKNVDRYLQTDSFRRLAKHTNSDLLIEEIEHTVERVQYDFHDQPCNRSKERKVLRTIRTIPLAEVQAAAALASTRAERTARGLRR